MKNHEYLAKLLEIEPKLLIDLDMVMQSKTGRVGILDKIADENKLLSAHAISGLNLHEPNPYSIQEKLRATAIQHESELRKFIEKVAGANEFEKAVNLAKKIGRPKKGFFLKKEFGKEILRRSRPNNLLDFLNFKTVDELFDKYDITEIFSALRFIETNEWMHKTFDETYSSFKAEDFEERDIEIKVLGPEWMGVALQFVAKKHHNVSHLKEFGVIFLNPIAENISGKFLRDFALLLHYYHEIEFYSKLFKKYSLQVDFSEKLKALLRGDVLQNTHSETGEWLIVQRYLFKENKNDERLFLPRVNPESLHWAKAIDNLILLGQGEESLHLEFWKDLDAVAELLNDGETDVMVSFDLEDNLMSAVSFLENHSQNLFYHQREALWTKIFEAYAGGRAKMEEMLLKNFDRGIIRF